MALATSQMLIKFTSNAIFFSIIKWKKVFMKLSVYTKISLFQVLGELKSSLLKSLFLPSASTILPFCLFLVLFWPYIFYSFPLSCLSFVLWSMASFLVCLQRHYLHCLWSCNTFWLCMLVVASSKYFLVSCGCVLLNYRIPGKWEEHSQVKTFCECKSGTSTKPMLVENK